MTLDDVIAWAPTVVDTLPQRHARDGDRDRRAAARDGASGSSNSAWATSAWTGASATLSTGERQRVQLARAVRNQTTGVLYVLDEPSIGLHPSNVDGLNGVIRDLLRDGNSVVLVDHDVQVLREADWFIEIGPGSGSEGGTVLADGNAATISCDNPSSLHRRVPRRHRTDPSCATQSTSEQLFDHGRIRLTTRPLHTVHALDVEIPKGRLTAVTGVSGSGKTTLVLESLVPALQAAASGEPAARARRVGGGRRASNGSTSSTPPRSAPTSGPPSPPTAASSTTCAAPTRPLDESNSRGLTASDFSYNTGSLRCPRCEGHGPDLPRRPVPARRRHPLPRLRRHPLRPRGTRHSAQTPTAATLPARPPRAHRETGAGRRPRTCPKVRRKLQTLVDLGLGYLTLGEDTPALSGGEAQRLKLATELGRKQSDALFVLDEPSVGLHPLDIRVLLGVIDRLGAKGATVIVIEHDLDMIANADYVIDMGPGGGAAGGTDRRHGHAGGHRPIHGQRHRAVSRT